MAEETRPETPEPASGAGRTANGPVPGAAASTVQAPAGSKWRRFGFRWLKRLGITFAIVLVVTIVLLIVADHQTSKPEFCGSCHIMKSYYESWHADVHGGKLEVACVDCHYAPGERTTLLSKMRGLSQVTSYMSGRYGASRPRAHVDNRSCMTSKCHGDMAFMDKELSLGTVKFTHAKHLQFDPKKREAKMQELNELTKSFSESVGQERFAKLEEVACEAVPAKEHLERMKKLVGDWNVKLDAGKLERFSQLQHWQVRVAQLDDLQCTNCHSYGASEKTIANLEEPISKQRGRAAHHFSVKTTSCFTCHFNNESFNTGTASCLLCHSLPTKEILVHRELGLDKSAKPKPPEIAKQLVRMDHQTILQRKVDCIACHADVAKENAPVTRRDCERCHDRPEYFQKWKLPLPLEQVKKYHAAHVPEQRAKCLDCHSEIHHQLVRGMSPSGQPHFLSSVMADCTQCHPNHHAEQIQLLSGVGGIGVPKSDPNMMFGSRTNCLGCHSKQAKADHGGTTLRGGINGCIACHGDRHNETFEKWKRNLKVMLMDAEEAHHNVRKMLESAQDLAPEARSKAAELLSAIQTDLRLVKTGNGVHNVMYAIELLDSVTRRCQEVAALVSQQGKK